MLQKEIHLKHECHINFIIYTIWLGSIDIYLLTKSNLRQICLTDFIAARRSLHIFGHVMHGVTAVNEILRVIQNVILSFRDPKIPFVTLPEALQ